MARNETVIGVPPEAVFEVLADPRTYAEWVVGSHEIRAADESWPDAGAAFDHTVGKPPLSIKDDTRVAASRPPVMLELLARARPLPTARIEMHLRPAGHGTHVTMFKKPSNRVVRVLGWHVMHALTDLRNRESRRRLKALAEGAAPRPGGVLPRRRPVAR